MISQNMFSAPGVLFFAAVRLLAFEFITPFTTSAQKSLKLVSRHWIESLKTYFQYLESFSSQSYVHLVAFEFIAPFTGSAQKSIKLLPRHWIESLESCFQYSDSFSSAINKSGYLWVCHTVRSICPSYWPDWSPLLLTFLYRYWYDDLCIRWYCCGPTVY